MDTFDLEKFLPYRFAVAAERLSLGLAKQYRAEFGISIPEWRVLAHLSQSDAVSIRDIEAKVSLEKSKVSRAASRLEAEGYVQKKVNPTDRRLLELSLTVKGRDLFQALMPIARAYQERLETALTDIDALDHALTVLGRDDL